MDKANSKDIRSKWTVARGTVQSKRSLFANLENAGWIKDVKGKSLTVDD